MQSMLFGTSGIRGDAKALFDSQFCFDIGRSFSKFLSGHHKKGGIAIGMNYLLLLRAKLLNKQLICVKMLRMLSVTLS